MTAAGDSPSPGRMLVRVVPDDFEEHPSRPALRGAASFVAQLIASARGVPQVRARRRADPAEVIAAYRETVERIRQLNVKS